MEQHSDDELLDLAARGALRDPGVLEAQVARMLADPRAAALVDNFGGQWLYLRNMALVAPDPYAFADFDANLRAAMARELELFLDRQIRRDHSVLELLTSDETFVNQRLAEQLRHPERLREPLPARRPRRGAVAAARPAGQGQRAGR